MDLRRGVNLALDAVVAHLKPRAKMISMTEELVQTGASEIEFSGKKDWVTDALNAAKAAVEEGILSIAGAPQICVQELEKIQTPNFDQTVGVQIMQNAGKMPAYTMAQYVEGAILVGKLLEQQSLEIGHDEAKGEYLDMVKAGIIHPANMIRTALTGAASISSLLRTADAVITELPKDDAPAFPPGARGGKGGMGSID